VSNTDSFIDEVTDEVRRDKLFALFRRYGWIGIVAVLLIVGGAAWNEWQKAQARARAEAFGDAVLTALDNPDSAARRAALAAVPATGQQSAVLGLLLASDPAQDQAATLAALDAVAADAALPVSYRDLAVLRRVSVAGAGMPVADRRAALEPLALEGRPYRPLAQEFLALLLVEAGDTGGAVTALQALEADPRISASQRQRVGQMIVALGGVSAAAQ
jgi:hypothetical protein